MKFIIRNAGAKEFDDDGNRLCPLEGAKLEDFPRWEVRSCSVGHYNSINRVRWDEVGIEHRTGDYGIRRRIGVRREWCIDLDIDGLAELLKEHGDMKLTICEDGVDLPPMITVNDY